MLFIIFKAVSNDKMAPVCSKYGINPLYTVQADPAVQKQAVTRPKTVIIKKKKKKSSDGT